MIEQYKTNNIKMKKCKNCSKQRQKSSKRQSSPQYQIVDEYGTAHMASRPKIVVCNDQYMLEFMFKTQRKTKKLDREVKQIKKSIRSLKKSLQKSKQRIRKQKSPHGHQSPQQEYIGYEKRQRTFSKTISMSSSKNREIGRFTRVSEGESQQFSKHSNKEEANFENNDQTKGIKIKKQQQNSNSKQTVKGAKQGGISFGNNSKQNNQGPMNNLARNKNRIFEYKQEIDNIHKIENSPTKSDLHRHIKSKDKKLQNKHFQKPNEKGTEKYQNKQQDRMKRIDSSGAQNSLNYSSNDKSSKQRYSKISGVEMQRNEFDRYMPTYEQIESSMSNLLDNEKQDSSEIVSQKARLQREFEQLIILQKNSTHEQKKLIREQIKALSKMLSNLQD